jgi:hypothetical protein
VKPKLATKKNAGDREDQMIDRKTALLCAVLIVLMFVMAVWRISTLEHWTISGENGATVPSLFLLIFPACSAFFVGALYWSGLRARADAAKLEPWRKWGTFFSISYCGGMLSVQVVGIIKSLHVFLPLHLWVIGRTLSVMMVIMCLLAINQAPKLPYVERRLIAGWYLGPIYGRRYIRTVARVTTLFMIGAIAYLLIPTSGGPRSTSLLFLATACLMAWVITWRIHLARKWKRQQSAEHGLT